MQNRYSTPDAEATVTRYAEQGVNRDLALRVYTTQLLGREPRLVLHGGGNTSVKTVAADLLGKPVSVVCVKGSGWDMGDIEPAGLPAVRLDPLREMIELDTLTDEEMVNAHRTNLLRSDAPTPSVETLLHAFLPHAYIDHTHANAVLSITDQPNGMELCREVYGDRAVVLPYIMPGFTLAKAAFEAFQDHPDCEGMILLKHGIFSFGSTDRASYDRMIDLVTLAEDAVAGGKRTLVQVPDVSDTVVAPESIAPLLRGLTGRFILEFRAGADILQYVNGAELERYGRAGVVTPDHVIRTKPWPLILDAPRPDDMPSFARAACDAMEQYVTTYRAYFDRHNTGETALDPMPRVVLIRGLGMFALGKSATAARVAADVAEASIRVITDAESIGRFESITEAETFRMEYWSLEQAKLGKAVEPPLARHVVAITGGAGTIGRATAAAFAAQGAEVALLDLDTSAVDQPEYLVIDCDVTDAEAVDAAFDRICETFGGVDIVVSNAGGAWQGRIGEVDDEVLRKSFELNFFAHQNVASAAVAIMRAQGFGGSLLFNVSKQAVQPGPCFGPYGLPKAATMALVRQYAVDHGSDGIRSNGVNADRIRSGMVDDELIAERAKAREVTEAEYMAGNLLHREVAADDVAGVFVALALAPATTGAIVTVDGGNIAAALR